MRHSRLKLVSLLFIVLLSAGLLGDSALAVTAPYETLTEDYRGRLVSSQTGYLPVRALTVFGDLELNGATDIFIQGETLYVADTVNGRIVVSTLRGELLDTVGEEVLTAPTGLFVNAEGHIYVADPRAEQVFVFSAEGELMESFGKPEEVLYGQENRFVPQKIVVDKAGSMYVISEGNTNGIAQLSAYGEFLGYFGANYTPLPINQIIRRLLFTDEQRGQLRLNVPSSPRNLDIDDVGLIHTVTQGAGDEGLKKFNMAGVNMLDRGSVDNNVADVATGQIDNIFAVSTSGYIYEYNREGNLIFLFGGRDDGRNRGGLFVSAAAIDVDSRGNLYVLDTEANSIQVFEKTEYAQTVHEAMSLYQRGQYVESKEPWEAVLSQNSFFDYANRGLGSAFYKLEDYEDSLAAFRLGGDRAGYSDSYWEVRNVFLKDNLIYIFIGILLLYAASKIIRSLDRRYAVLGPVKRARKRFRNISLIQQIGFLSYVPRNPADAYYGIKKEKKVSLLSSTIIYGLFFAIYVISKYFSGFLFKSVGDGQYTLVMDAVRVFGLLALFIVSNHLISSIREGEGKLRDVYNGLAYSLVPYLALKPIVFLLSHVLTHNESFIITFLNGIIYTAVIILVYVMIKEIQYYTFRDTFINVFLTLFTMAIFLITGIIIFSFISQVFDFIVSIFMEVVYRVS